MRAGQDSEPGESALLYLSLCCSDIARPYIYIFLIQCLNLDCVYWVYVVNLLDVTCYLVQHCRSEKHVHFATRAITSTKHVDMTDKM